MNTIQKTVGTIGTSAYAFLVGAATTFAQITIPGGAMASTTVGAPKTGAAEELALNVAMLTLAALLVVGGSVYMLRTKKTA